MMEDTKIRILQFILHVPLFFFFIFLFFYFFYMYHYVSYIKQTTKSPPSTGSAFLSDC